MQQVTLAEASENLAQFIDAALKGEEIIIIKDEQPVVKLTVIEPVKRYPAKAGSAKGLVWISDDFDEPLEDFKEYME
jgi:antitoxin (DNA-binding transcriptional repressor) of toxin-antitoxin stability system